MELHRSSTSTNDISWSMCVYGGVSNYKFHNDSTHALVDTHIYICYHSQEAYD